MKHSRFQQFVVNHRPLAMLIALAALAPTPVMAQSYTLVDLGVPTSSEPVINNNGQVVASQFDAFLYTNGNWADLGQPAGAQYSYAWSCNNNGDIAGLSSFPNNQYRATLYTSSTGWTIIPTFGGSLSWPQGINDNDVVVGYSETAVYPNPGTTYGFWFQNGVMHAIPTLGGSANYAFAVNNAGQVTGYGPEANGYYSSFIYDINTGQLTDLGIPAGYEEVAALSINANGHVGGFVTDNTGSHQYPCIFENGAWTILPLSSPNADSGQIASLNVHDQGVGDEYQQDPVTGRGSNHPMLYQNGTELDLTQFSTPTLQLYDVNSINDNGVIVGVANLVPSPVSGPPSHIVELVPSDTTPPTTTATITGLPQSATITLSATDPDNASNTLTTYYTLDGGAQQTYSGAISVTAGGTHSISFYSVDPAGNVEATQTQSFTLNYALPTITSLSPASRTEGTGTFTMTVNGTGFAPVSTVKFGTHILTPSGSTSTTLTVSVPGTYILTVGKIKVFVINPTPGGGQSLSKNFSVNAPVLSSVKVVPSKVIGPASSTGTVTLTGPAPVGGVVVNVSSLTPSVATTAVTSVTVLAGSKTATFTINTSTVAVVTLVTIKAVDPKGTTKTVTLTVKP